MFKRLPRSLTATVRVLVEEQPVDAAPGDTVAAAMLAAGFTVMRSTPVTGAERGPYCLMGVCFDCLVEIDGVPNRQACLTPVREGMRIHRQAGARQAATGKETEWTIPQT